MYDIALVGLGPNNLAIMYHIIQTNKPVKMAIIEKNDAFVWHPAYPTGHLQIVASKASVTAQTSDPFYFPAYLKRLYRLTENETLASKVSHEVYRLYLGKIFNKIRNTKNLDVYFGQTVEHIRRGKDSAYEISVQSSRDKQAIESRVVSLGIGGTSKPSFEEIPISNFQAAIRSFSSSDSLCADLHFQVRGSGQSAADAVCELARLYPHSSIDWVVREGIPRVCDENPFVNDVYTYEAAIRFYLSSPEQKKALLKHMHGTNSGVIAFSTLDRIHQKAEQRQVKILAQPDDKKEYNLKFLANGVVDQEEAIGTLLPEIDRSFQLKLDFRIAGHNIYIPGGLYRTHGPTAGTICDLGKRAQLVGQSMINRFSCDKLKIALF